MTRGSAIEWLLRHHGRPQKPAEAKADAWLGDRILAAAVALSVSQYTPKLHIGPVYTHILTNKFLASQVPSDLAQGYSSEWNLGTIVESAVYRFYCQDGWYAVSDWATDLLQDWINLHGAGFFIADEATDLKPKQRAKRASSKVIVPKAQPPVTPRTAHKRPIGPTKPQFGAPKEEIVAWAKELVAKREAKKGKRGNPRWAIAD